jgi:hypothetical protein
MIHVVMDGVPRRTEATLSAVGVIVDDVDAGDAGDFIHRTVIISNSASIFQREIATIACCGCTLPDTLYYVIGIILGIAFLIETSALTAYHIEEDAITDS